MVVKSSKKICIYCEKTEGEVAFGSREHVVPELMGKFDNNLTLIDWVCNKCNSSVFNPLETRFKEDTQEGIMIQMMNFLDSPEIRVRNNKLKMVIDLGMEEKFFNEAFPFLTFKDDAWQMTYIPQIKIKGYAKNGYIILIIDKVKALPRTGKKFRKLQNILKNFKSKDVSIFVHGEDDPERRDLKEAIVLVKELGIDYKPGTEKTTPFVGDGTDKARAEVSMNGTIDSDVVRIIAKISFNYFAYCATQSGQEVILYHANFARIKSYILGNTELPLKEVIIERPTYKGLLIEEVSQAVRLPGHTLTLQNENGNLVAKVSFAGRFVYSILLGKMPDELNRPDFGNGHMFDPRHKQIFGMSQNPARWKSDEPMSFSLFNNG